ncbi:hypothetical protein SLS62_005096 [Diatrype stigma]|uniref:Rhodopsin domain-containing protein n=1 Tax=Diatrype stigma TaxID=117547 RepID=A0AAN9UTK8_9PEZI
MDQNEEETIVGGVMAGIAIASVALRFYSRHTQKAALKMDDWLILIALLGMIGIDVISIYASTVYPDGSETASTESHEYTADDVQYTKLLFTTSVLYFTITATTKLSILSMYNRLFSASAAFRLQIVILAALVVSFGVACTLADLLNCVPLEWAWINSQADPRYCINFNIFWFAAGICEAFIDVLIIVMPIRVVFLLQFNRAKKIAVAALFLFGVL